MSFRFRYRLNGLRLWKKRNKRLAATLREVEREANRQAAELERKARELRRRAR